MLFPASQRHANSAFLLAAAARSSGWSISATMLPETDLSKFPTGGFDRLELLIVKAQLLAFYRLKGYSYSPEFQYFRGLDNDINLSINDTDKRLSEVNEHTIHVGRIGDQTGTRDSKAANRSRRKRKHNLKDDVYQEKRKSLLERASVTPDSTHRDYQNDEAFANLTHPVLSKKRKTINHYAGVSAMKGRKKTISLEKSSNTTVQSFKIGECIRRVASQLIGPPSLLKCFGNRSQMKDVNADSFSGNESHSFSPNLEETQKSSLTIVTEVSSLDDLLYLLHCSTSHRCFEYQECLYHNDQMFKASKDLLNEVERNLQDAMSVARNMIKNPKLVPGGGAAEMTVSAALKQKSSSIEGIKKWPYEASACQIKIKKDHW
ncbi:hypothetical protein KIW84_021695 [Lathyrus oleraceus]|uniref:Uncharacterized protein n=1 Tax=Pisum sativum TaxID=3888 RepID=A0A9D5BA83_PEA|nr:hypothetical protein KIW84_021695 [Pisum sativum]